MKKIVICGASVSALMLAVALSTPQAGAAAAGKSSKDIMGALFKGPKSAMGTLKAATKSESPDWAKIQKATDTFLSNAEALPETKPPRGDKSSYEKLAKVFAKNAKALDDAADAKDLDGVKAAMGKIGGSCMGCHKDHKPN